VTATSLAPLAPAAVLPERRSGLWNDAWRRLRRNRAALVAGVVLALIALLAILAPWLPIADPAAQNLALGATPPSVAHWFGTDELGRDTFARTLYGGRISLLVGSIGTLVSLLIGVTYGAVSGYVGGKTDEVMMRFVDILYSLPYIFLVILLLVFFSRSILMLFVALGLVQWLTMARIVRGQVLSLREKEFVEAARSLGASHSRIIFREILPNLVAPIIVYSTILIPQVILFEAALSFLGIGIDPGTPSWGSMISDAVGVFDIAWWFMTFPGLALVLTVLAFNLVGDGLQDALNPRTAK